MPKTIKLESHLDAKELESRYRKAHDRVLRSHYQILWLIGSGNTTTQVMEVTGYSRGWIQTLARRYNEGGPEALGDRRHENPGAKERALLTPDQREELREALKKPPPDGGMWNSRKVGEWIEARTGRRVSQKKQRGWEYLKRLGQSPKVPRPHHASADTKKRILLVLDQAGWHTAKNKLVVPEGIHLEFLPSHSPELMPAERLWPLSNEGVSNRYFEEIEELEEALVERCVALLDQPELIRSYIRYHWWPEAA